MRAPGFRAGRAIGRRKLFPRTPNEILSVTHKQALPGRLGL
jgi:hypothetical protein